MRSHYRGPNSAMDEAWKREERLPEGFWIGRGEVGRWVRSHFCHLLGNSSFVNSPTSVFIHSSAFIDQALILPGPVPSAGDIVVTKAWRTSAPSKNCQMRQE